MFSKKKTSDFSLFSYESDNRRASYRLRPPRDQSVTFRFGEKEYRALDIGGGGLSFESAEFSEGDVGPISLTLPGDSNTISPVLEVQHIGKQGICHCKFIEIADDDVERIHQYLLAKQKELARSRRQRRRTHLVYLSSV